MGETRPHPGHGPASGGGLTWRDVLKRRNFWLLVAVYLPMLALYGACMQNLAPVAASHGLSQQTAGTLLSAFSLTHVASTLVMGLLSDRFGNRLPLCGLALAVAVGGLIVSFGQGVAMLWPGRHARRPRGRTLAAARGSRGCRVRRKRGRSSLRAADDVYPRDRAGAVPGREDPGKRPAATRPAWPASPR